MHLILTHENADFDAVASQLAAHKLHPDAVPLLSRRVNRNVNQFLTLYWDSLPFMRQSEWKRRRVDTVTLVDTQSVPGVRGLKDDAAVHVIDHHAPAEMDPAWEAHVEQLGAATTLLVERLQNAGLSLSTLEATLLLLGIYEDTGSLTYGTTTARDARAAAWLLEQDAQLSIVQRFLEIPLSAAQQELYNRLQQGTEWLRLEGQTIAVATAEAPDDFDDEISAVAHRLRDAMAPAGLLLLVQLPRHVQLVARSTTDDVDVSVVARAFGGGGHGRAAAATIMDHTLQQAQARVKELLADAVQPMTRVSAIMSRGVQTLSADATVAEAAQQMQRFGHEGYPVIDAEKQRLAGLLTRRAVDRAISHGLERLQVSQVMKSGRLVVRPGDSIARVQELMMDEDWGQIPVVGDGAEEEGPDDLIGIVTRTDLLRLLTQGTRDEEESDLRQLLAESLSPAVWALVQTAGRAAAAAGMPLYFVGGLVRDMLLERPAGDIDMVVEGDAIKLARQLRREFGGRIRSHGRFGTAKWFPSAKSWRSLAPDAPQTDVPEFVDFVSARTEFYTRPTALPQVENSSIKLDLHRRDFTINTLAIRLDGAHLGQLLDFYGGMRDLEQGIIRVLHSLSFVDDPTRILRAARLEQRLGFTIEPRTAELIADGLPMLERITGQRIRHEIELALEEADPIPIMERLAELNVLAHIHPGLSWQPPMGETWRRLQQLAQEAPWQAALQGGPPTSILFALWLTPLPATVREEVMERLRVRKQTQEEVAGVAALLLALAGLPADPKPSEVEKTLRPYADRPRILLATRAVVGDDPTGAYLDRYQQEWRHVETALDGHDLRDLGLKPGPRFAVLLDRLLAARLDGQVANEEEERALLHALISHQ